MKIDIKKVVLWLVVIMLGSFLMAGWMFQITGGIEKLSYNHEEYEDASEINTVKNFDINDLTLIDAEGISDEVNIIFEDREDIKVHYHGSGKSKMPKLVTGRRGNNLNIDIVYPKTVIKIFDMGWSRTALDIYVPEDYSENFKVHTVSGEIEIENFGLNELELSTVSGEIVAKNGHANSIYCKTISGDVTMKEITVIDAILKSTSGDLLADDYIGEELSAKTVSGTISISYEAFNGDAEFDTTSGDVILEVPKNAGFEVDFNTVSGELSNDFPISVTQSSRKNIRGIVGNGENSIQAKSVSGDIEIREK